MVVRVTIWKPATSCKSLLAVPACLVSLVATMKVSLRMLFLCFVFCTAAMSLVRATWLLPLREHARALRTLEERGAHPSRHGTSAPFDAGRQARWLSSTSTTTRWDMLRSIVTGVSNDDLAIEVVEFHKKLGGATDDDLRAIAKVSTIQKLDLTYLVVEQLSSGIRSFNAGAPLSTDAGIQSIRGLPRLRYLNVSGSRVTDAACRDLSGSQSLEVLSADGTAITDAGLASLAAVHTLKELWLRNTYVTPEGAAAFRRRRPDVRLFL